MEGLKVKKKHKMILHHNDGSLGIGKYIWLIWAATCIRLRTRLCFEKLRDSESASQRDITL